MRNILVMICVLCCSSLILGQSSSRTSAGLMQSGSRSSANSGSPRSSGNNSAVRPPNPAMGGSNRDAAPPHSTYMPRMYPGNRPAYSRNTKAATQNGKKAPALDKPAGKINWMTIEEALEKSKTEKRKIFIDVYTNWCGWCKHMDSTTFIDPAVAAYMNAHFYPVKFNAEQNEDVVFKNKTYRFKRENGRNCHELAAEWLNNRLSFPTAVFLDENQNLIQPLAGYLESRKLEAILNYFGTDSHRTTPWETYERKFTSAQNGGK
ncbi:MAG: DUF255 domain-containing protein [Bacteroidetes bacterium]|nr:DUF255 domain-containing protein [Bacteroidota bacterium]